MDHYPNLKPIITSNINIPPLNSIQQHAGDTHSLSLISMALLDPSYKTLTITAKYNNNIIARQALEHVIGVWSNYKPIKTKVRSFKICNGDKAEFLDQAYGITFSEILPLDTVASFGGYKVIIDIEYNQSYTCKIYRELEPNVRTLTIEYHSDE
jgi:hypothetical protein